MCLLGKYLGSFMQYVLERIVKVYLLVLFMLRFAQVHVA